MLCKYDAQEDALYGKNQYMTVLSEEKQCSCFKERICLGTVTSSSQLTVFVKPIHCKYRLLSFDLESLDKFFYKSMITFWKCIKFATLFQYFSLYLFIFNFSFHVSATQWQCQNYIRSILPTTNRTTKQTEDCLFALDFDSSASLCEKYSNCADKKLFYLHSCLMRHITSKFNESTTPWVLTDQTDSNVCLVHCNNVYARLFCDHLPLEAILGASCTSLYGSPCNEANCRKKLKQIFQSDSYAKQNFTSFEKVMKHYVTSHGYSIQGSMTTCLVSLSVYTIFVKHEM